MTDEIFKSFLDTVRNEGSEYRDPWTTLNYIPLLSNLGQLTNEEFGALIQEARRLFGESNKFKNYRRLKVKHPEEFIKNL